MRPQIPEELAERCEAAASKHGYTSSAEVVRDAVRRWLDALESEGGGTDSVVLQRELRSPRVSTDLLHDEDSFSLELDEGEERELREALADECGDAFVPDDFVVQAGVARVRREAVERELREEYDDE